MLPGQAGGNGGVGNDTRLFINAIRFLAKTGIAWADLPTYYGKSNGARGQGVRFGCHPHRGPAPHTRITTPTQATDSTESD